MINVDHITYNSDQGISITYDCTEEHVSIADTFGTVHVALEDLAQFIDHVNRVIGI